MKKLLALGLISVSIFSISACGGSGGNTASGPVSVSPPPPPPPPPPSSEITLTGQSAKGLLKNARVFVFESNSVRNEDPITIAEVTTSSSAGDYSLTFDTNEIADLGDYLIISVVLNEADIVCDAPNGCGTMVAFGETYQVQAADNQTIPVLPFYAVIPTPETGSSTTVNVNPFTHLTFTYFDYLISQRENIQFLQEDLDAAQERISNIFELTNEEFHSLPFIDITQTITSSNANAIRASLLSGGFQSALVEYEGIGANIEGFELGFFELTRDFFVNAGELIAHENDDFKSQISLEDILDNAQQIEGINSTATNVYDMALQSIKDSYALVKDSKPFVRTSDGVLQPRGPNEPPEFLDTYYQALDGESGPIQITTFDPDGIEEMISFVLNDGGDASFFNLSETGELTSIEAFDCQNPKDLDNNQNYILNVTINDGEFDVTEDIRIEIFEQDGSSCSSTNSTKPRLEKTTEIYNPKVHRMLSKVVN